MQIAKGKLILLLTIVLLIVILQLFYIEFDFRASRSLITELNHINL
jgi:uncharacterized protein (UPF0333 family)